MLPPWDLFSRSLFVAGVARPQGSKKHVGHGRMIEQSKYLPQWRKDVHNAAVKALEEDGRKMDGPIECSLTFFLPRPKNHPKTKPTYPTTQPDLSKLIRAVEDSLTTAGWWADDARVIRSIAEKHYSIPTELVKLSHMRGYEVPVGVMIETRVLEP